MTDDQALWAIGKVQSGEMTQTQVAKELGAPLSRINALITGRTYKHLHGTDGLRMTDGGVRYGLDETPERRRFREAKFWSRVDRSGGVNSCWPFIGAKPDKYGHSAAGQGMAGSAAAHVVAYTLAMGLPKAPAWDLVLRHLCDFKPCCNPAHLMPGTVGENLADRWEAQREGRTGARSVANPVAAPSGGWKIPAEDLEELDRIARISEFHSRVDSSAGPDACWPWIAKSRHKFGYGFMAWEGQKTVMAHRIAYLIANDLRRDQLPSSIKILHKCPEGALRHNCNNPGHLTTGSQAENIADKTLHGTMPLGEGHHMGQRYSDALIRDLRERYWHPAGIRPTQTELAEEAGAAVAVVSRWLKGQSRREAGGPMGPSD